MEDSGLRARHNTLIQLSTRISDGRHSFVSLEGLREQLTRAIQGMVKNRAIRSMPPASIP